MNKMSITKAKQGRGTTKLTIIPHEITTQLGIVEGTILNWEITPDNEIKIKVQEGTTKKDKEYQKYRSYLEELLEKDGVTATKEFYDAFDELFSYGAIGGVISDWRGVKCFYLWNKENIETGTKEDFIRKYEHGVCAV